MAGAQKPGSVTASPAKGIEATVALCAELQLAGFTAVPHLSARMIRDRAHLVDLVAWLFHHQDEAERHSDQRRKDDE